MICPPPHAHIPRHSARHAAAPAPPHAHAMPPRIYMPMYTVFHTLGPITWSRCEGGARRITHTVPGEDEKQKPELRRGCHYSANSGGSHPKGTGLSKTFDARSSTPHHFQKTHRPAPHLPNKVLNKGSIPTQGPPRPMLQLTIVPICKLLLVLFN